MCTVRICVEELIILVVYNMVHNGKKKLTSLVIKLFGFDITHTHTHARTHTHECIQLNDNKND